MEAHAGPAGMTGQICVPDTAVHRVQTTDICMQAGDTGI